MFSKLLHRIRYQLFTKFIIMNMQVVLVCYALFVANHVLGLPPNYEDVEDAQDQPENAKG